MYANLACTIELFILFSAHREFTILSPKSMAIYEATIHTVTKRSDEVYSMQFSEGENPQVLHTLVRKGDENFRVCRDIAEGKLKVSDIRMEISHGEVGSARVFLLHKITREN